MKKIKKKLVAVILAITILGTGLIGSYTTVPAAEFSAGALAAYETLEWITAAFAGAGFTISVKELLKPRKSEIEKDLGKDIDWDNYDWGDMLDSPAAQDQIDELDKTINKLYGNASAKWKEMYEKSLSPTPTPESSPDQPQLSPPVTVAPIDPDKVTPPDWDTLRKASMKNGYLALGAATYWCLKEAVSNLWNKMVGRPENLDSSISQDDLDMILSYGLPYYYIDSHYIILFSEGTFGVRDNKKLYNSRVISSYAIRYYKPSGDVSINGGPSYPLGSVGMGLGTDYGEYGFSTNVHLFDSYEEGNKWSQNQFAKAKKQPPKTAIWVSPNLKNDYDNNKSPSIPATAPAPAIKIPSLDDLKDLQNRGNNANDDERPSIILDWLKNHYTNPSTDPNPKPDPDPNPNPNPNPNPDPTTAPNPDPDISGVPKPTGVPKPSTSPEEEDTEVDPDKYKTDLRLVFPFCIPFDLVHLIQAFEAEPEAPVFEFPLDLELENPWTGKKILDYHHVFKLDMSDYEPVIKIFRIFEIIFFIIGLLMITRQQMIKG